MVTFYNNNYERKLQKLAVECSSLLIGSSYLSFSRLAFVHHKKLLNQTQNPKTVFSSNFGFVFPLTALTKNSKSLCLLYPLSYQCHFPCLLGISAVFLLNPVRKDFEGVHVSPVMLLCEFKQHRPCEIRIYPWTPSVHQLPWWAYHLIISRTQKES